jgi:hypothetical protein
VNVFKQFDGFHLDQNLILNQQVCEKLANDHSFIPDLYGILLLHAQANLRNCYASCIFVHLFEKASAQRVADLEDTPDNLLGDFVDFHKTLPPFTAICVYLCLSAAHPIGMRRFAAQTWTGGALSLSKCFLRAAAGE